MTSAELAKPAAAARLVALVRALRVHQWVKNLLVFVPVVLDHKLFAAEVVAKSATAFLAFCCAASSAYILNDLLDLEADRRHPTKRFRPFAAGTLSPSELRAEKPDDVLYAGGNGREPASFAEVELLFDNEAGCCSGNLTLGRVHRDILPADAALHTNISTKGRPPAEAAQAPP